MGIAAVPRQADLRKLKWRVTFVLDPRTSTYCCMSNHQWNQTGRIDTPASTSWGGITVFSDHQLAFEPQAHYDYNFQHIDINNYFEHIHLK
eukprot:1624369-Amphidinium_carterae.1